MICTDNFHILISANLTPKRMLIFHILTIKCLIFELTKQSSLRKLSYTVIPDQNVSGSVEILTPGRTFSFAIINTKTNKTYFVARDKTEKVYFSFPTKDQQDLEIRLYSPFSKKSDEINSVKISFNISSQFNFFDSDVAQKHGVEPITAQIEGYQKIMENTINEFETNRKQLEDFKQASTVILYMIPFGALISFVVFLGVNFYHYRQYRHFIKSKKLI